ncbi:hypothetical protein A7Q09_03840 [Methylacidiphilum sp. Yel]|nr:hypothetical protein A7Q09_03840 [Methylacidiphilum sp. Yel]
MRVSGSIKTSTPSSESLPWLNLVSYLQESPAFRHGEDVKVQKISQFELLKVIWSFFPKDSLVSGK